MSKPIECVSIDEIVNRYILKGKNDMNPRSLIIDVPKGNRSFYVQGYGTIGGELDVLIGCVSTNGKISSDAYQIAFRGELEVGQEHPQNVRRFIIKKKGDVYVYSETDFPGKGK